MTHPFRFGIIAAPYGGRDQWLAGAATIADRGYSTLLTPDNAGRLHSPFTALAVASAVPDLRLGTFVLAAPVRAPQAAAWEGHSLSVLSGGRFEFGIGTGRPDSRAEAEAFGRPWGTAAERLENVRQSIAELRKADGAARTPVMLAAGGPKALALAAEEADIVTLAAIPSTPRADVVRMADELRELAGGRDIELALNMFVVGDEVPPFAQRMLGGSDPSVLHESGSLNAVRGTPQEIADELRRRRDESGISYYVLEQSYVESFAPVVELLRGT